MVEGRRHAIVALGGLSENRVEGQLFCPKGKMSRPPAERRRDTLSLRANRDPCGVDPGVSLQGAKIEQIQPWLN